MHSNIVPCNNNVSSRIIFNLHMFTLAIQFIVPLFFVCFQTFRNQFKKATASGKQRLVVQSKIGRGMSMQMLY